MKVIWYNQLATLQEVRLVDGARDRQNEVVGTVFLMDCSGNNNILGKVPQVERWTRNEMILLRFWEGSCRVGNRCEVLCRHLLMRALDGKVHKFGWLGQRFRP